jgi:hypothetical protein
MMTIKKVELKSTVTGVCKYLHDPDLRAKRVAVK